MSHGTIDLASVSEYSFVVFFIYISRICLLSKIKCVLVIRVKLRTFKSLLGGILNDRHLMANWQRGNAMGVWII